MNCTQAEQLIPLYAGDDLPAEQAAAVGAHLESCASCRGLATEFTASRNWLSACTTPTFDETVFDDLRAAVRREIARAEPQPALLAKLAAWWQPRFALAAVAALLLLVGLSFYAYRQQTAPVKEAPLVQTDANQKQTEPAPGSAPGASNGNKAAVAAQQPPRRRSVRRSSVMKTPTEAALPAQNVAATTNNADGALNQAANQLAARETTRIEFQTADPNIRIIWFAPQADLASTSKRN